MKFLFSATIYLQMMTVTSSLSLDLTDLSSLVMQPPNDDNLLEQLRRYQHISLANPGVQKCLKLTKKLIRNVIDDFELEVRTLPRHLTFSIRIPYGFTSELFVAKYDHASLLECYLEPVSAYDQRFFLMCFDNYKLLIEHIFYSINRLSNYVKEAEKYKNKGLQVDTRTLQINEAVEITYFKHKIVTAINFLINLVDPTYSDSFIFIKSADIIHLGDSTAFILQYEDYDTNFVARKNNVRNFRRFFDEYVTKNSCLFAKEIESILANKAGPLRYIENSGMKDLNHILSVVGKVQSNESRFVSLAISKFDYNAKQGKFYTVNDTDRKNLQIAGFGNGKTDDNAFSDFIATFNIDSDHVIKPGIFDNFTFRYKNAIENFEINFTFFHKLQIIAENYYFLVENTLKWKKLQKQIRSVDKNLIQSGNARVLVEEIGQNYVRTMTERIESINAVASRNDYIKGDIMFSDVENAITDSQDLAKGCRSLERLMIWFQYDFKQCETQKQYEKHRRDCGWIFKKLGNGRKRLKSYKEIFVRDFCHSSKNTLPSFELGDSYNKLMAEKESKEHKSGCDELQRKIWDLENKMALRLQPLLQINFFIYHDLIDIIEIIKSAAMLLTIDFA